MFIEKNLNNIRKVKLNIFIKRFFSSEKFFIFIKKKKITRTLKKLFDFLNNNKQVLRSTKEIAAFE